MGWRRCSRRRWNGEHCRRPWEQGRRQNGFGAACARNAEEEECVGKSTSSSRCWLGHGVGTWRVHQLRPQVALLCHGVWRAARSARSAWARRTVRVLAEVPRRRWSITETPRRSYAGETRARHVAAQAAARSGARGNARRRRSAPDFCHCPFLKECNFVSLNKS